MSTMIIVMTVLAQVLVFQFLSVAFTKSVARVQLGDLPEPLAGRLHSYLKRASRFRYMLGAGLLLAAVVIRWLLPLAIGPTKLLLAVVSVGSSAAFVAAVVRDRRTMRAVYDELPEAGVRRASLTPRPAGYWYNPNWELVPICTVAVTLAYVYWLTLELTSVPALVWVWLGAQAVFAFGALWYAARRGMRVPNVSRRLASFRNQPELALQFGERLASLEAGYFMVAKILIAFLLGLMVVQAGIDSTGSAGGGTVDLLKWLLVGLLVLAYLLFVWRLGRIAKGALTEVEQKTARVL